MEDSTIEYWQIVQRVRETPLPGIDKDLLLAEIDEVYWRAARVRQERPALVRCEEAPELLRRVADELEWLEAERAAESAKGGSGPTQLRRSLSVQAGKPLASGVADGDQGYHRLEGQTMAA